MSEHDWQTWFEGIWALREETLYRSYFGDLGKGIYPIPIQTFQRLGIPEPDPRFLFHGVFECPPTDKHPDWIYVTSGMSNAWGDSPDTADPHGTSGLGCEYVLHTSSRQAWGIEILHWLMAVQLGVAMSKLKGDFIQPGDRIGLGAGIPVKDGPGLIIYLLVCTPDDPGLSADVAPLLYPAEFSLPTGRVDMLLLVGITLRERDFAQSQGVEGLITLLRHHEVFPRTEPARATLV